MLGKGVDGDFGALATVGYKYGYNTDLAETTMGMDRDSPSFEILKTLY